MPVWNPWHGCKKISPGCEHCYVYRRDASFGKDSSIVSKTASFDLPRRRNRQGAYKLLPTDEPVYTCMTSDFFLEEADGWRAEAWDMMRERSDLHFVIITKRISRFAACIPDDWGTGYENVTVICTCENQRMTEKRMPVFLSVPIRHKGIIHEPMLEAIDIEPYLKNGQIEQVICGGESGDSARLCDYAWILHIREQCVKYHVSFWFKQTGAHFKKGSKVYYLDRKIQMSQAKKAGIDYAGTCESAPHTEESLFDRLSRSAFRSRFSLKQSDVEYIRQKGMDTIRRHAEDFVRTRLAPAYIPNDGGQTPMRGHPVFVAQHATATCCRGCLKKWHGMEPGAVLSREQQAYVVDVIMAWIQRQCETFKN